MLLFRFILFAQETSAHVVLIRKNAAVKWALLTKESVGTKWSVSLVGAPDDIARQGGLVLVRGAPMSAL